MLSFFSHCWRYLHALRCLLISASLTSPIARLRMCRPGFARLVLAVCTVVFLGSGSPAFALIATTTGYEYSPSRLNPRQWMAGAEACGVERDYYQSLNPSSITIKVGSPTFTTYVEPYSGCRLEQFNNGSLVQTFTSALVSRAKLSCPPNSTLDPGGSGCTCDSGYKENAAKTACEPASNCVATEGTMRKFNSTIGWARNPDPGPSDYLGPVTQSPISFCSGGCTWDRTTANTYGDIPGFISQVPTSQGLYRMSEDIVYRQSAASCSAALPSSLDKATPNPTCPGFVGEVNGKSVCVGTASKPLPPSSGTAPPMQKGNPAAGEKPATGEGSGEGGAGRTPSSGNGGNSGGPAAAAGLTGAPAPTGTISKPADGQEQAACGAPGQPPCRIDESGTPSEVKMELDKTALDDKARELRDKVSGQGDKGSLFNGAWPDFFRVPALVPCQPVTMPGWLGVDVGQLDICGSVDWARDVMAWIWAFGGFWLCLGMVRGVL